MNQSGLEHFVYCIRLNKAVLIVSWFGPVLLIRLPKCFRLPAGAGCIVTIFNVMIKRVERGSGYLIY